MKPKPRLKQATNCNPITGERFHSWVCIGLGSFGIGKTPMDAYNQWRSYGLWKSGRY